MSQFVPDAESISAFFGEFEAAGYRVELVKAPRMGGYALRMPLGPGNEVLPVFALPASQMQTEEAAQRWMERLRDEQLSQFRFLLRRPGMGGGGWEAGAVLSRGKTSSDQ